MKLGRGREEYPHYIFMADPRICWKNVKLRVIPTFLIENQINRQNKRIVIRPRWWFLYEGWTDKEALYSITHVLRAHTDGDLHVSPPACFSLLLFCRISVMSSTVIDIIVIRWINLCSGIHHVTLCGSSYLIAGPSLFVEFDSGYKHA